MSIKPESETAFQDVVIQYARLKGWLTAHFRASRTARGWRTPVQGDGKGFPDTVLVRARDRRVIFAELKSVTGKLSAAQIRWMVALGAAGAETYVWQPKDWPAIERTLA